MITALIRWSIANRVLVLLITGLLTGWGQDQYGFMHLGFQEYLAACEVRRLTFEGDAAALQELAARYGEGWWQEVILMLLALGNPSLFVPFMREVVQCPQFTRVPELLNLILEEAAEVSDAPFVELLAEPPGTDPGLWSRQRYALRVLEQVAEEATLDEAAQRLGRHPARERAAISRRGQDGCGLDELPSRSRGEV